MYKRQLHHRSLQQPVSELRLLLFPAVETTLTCTTSPLPPQYTTHTCLQKQSPPPSLQHRNSLPLLLGRPVFSRILFREKHVPHPDFFARPSLSRPPRPFSTPLVCEKSWLTNSLMIFLFSSAWRFSCCSAAPHFISGSTSRIFSLLIYVLAHSLLLPLRNHQW